MKNFVKSLKRKNVLMCILIILGSIFLLNFLSVKEGFPNWEENREDRLPPNRFDLPRGQLPSRRQLRFRF